MNRPVFLLLMLAGLVSLAPSTHAAESGGDCTGFITSLPATISTQGTWCLRLPLSTSATAGAAVTLAGNNITLDCNGFPIDGIATSGAVAGVLAVGRLNTTVRNCAIRGFLTGIELRGPGGNHLVEGNRVHQSRQKGIAVGGEHNLVRDNLVTNTAGLSPVGIQVHGDAVGNTVSQVRTTRTGDPVTAILLEGEGSVARANIIRYMDQSNLTGIALTARHQSAIDNGLHTAYYFTNGAGIRASAGKTTCRGNTVGGFSWTPISGCAKSADNWTY